MADDYVFTSESVSNAHPDKVCDQISDAILDAVLSQDLQGRVAANTVCNKGLVLLAGEITTTAQLDFIQIARNVLHEIGYDSTEFGIDSKACAVLMGYGKQSLDIAMGVNKSYDDPLEQGAGDQGMMFGYAVDETPELMPLPVMLAHRLMQRQLHVRQNNTFGWLRPDGKSQVTVKYRAGIPYAIDTVVVSTQHSPEIDLKTLRECVIEEIIKPTLPEDLVKGRINFLVNPTGRFVVGGPEGDSGLTGRKIIVDTYGSAAPHGGGAFSGKDPSKVDRSGAYACRYVAKNIVAAGLAKKCLIQVCYAIGVAKPVSIMVETFGTSKISNTELIRLIEEHFDLRPRGMINMLDLLKPIYKSTAAFGHFGREEAGFTWERCDKAPALAASAS